MDTPDSALPEAIGRYRIVRLLGQGAMGRVLLAHDPVLDRDVAVKLLRDDLGIAQEQLQALIDRMRHEARASARVSHPNIVALHDMGEDAEANLYLVFEYVEGPTLKDRAQRGGLGPEAAAKLAREIGSALTIAHAAGVLHRDIKPENIMLAATGAKIADFGIARVPDSTLTRNGGLLGTPAYSAPESIANGTFSPLSDQFSMASTLYEAISGRRAFPGDDAVAVASKISTDEPPRIAEICGLDRHVDTVLARAFSKNPRSRFNSCDEFGRALAEALELMPRTAMPTLPDRYHREGPPDDQPPARRGRSLWAALLGVVLGGLLVLGGRYAMQEWLPVQAALPAPSVEAAHPPRDPPVAFLAERPQSERRKHSGSRPSSARDEASEKSDASASGTDAGLFDADASDPDSVKAFPSP